MRFRLGEILEERGLNPYRLHKLAEAKGLDLTVNKASRLARGSWALLSGDTLELLCELLDLTTTATLFEQEPKVLGRLKQEAKEAAGRRKAAALTKARAAAKEAV